MSSLRDDPYASVTNLKGAAAILATKNRMTSPLKNEGMESLLQAESTIQNTEDDHKMDQGRGKEENASLVETDAN